MKKGTRFLTLVLVLSILMMSMAGITAVSADQQELRTVTVMTQMFDGSSGYSAANRENYPVYQEFVKQTNALGLDVQFDLVANEQYEVVLQTRFASGADLADIINAYSYVTDVNAVAYGDRGMVADIYTILDQYDDDDSIMNRLTTYFPEVLGFATTETGKMYWTAYCFGSKPIEDVEPMGSTYGLNLRKDWMEQVGLEWKFEMNTDELFEALVKFTEEDVNGSGTADETINIMITGFENGIAQAFGLPIKFADFVSDREGVQCPWLCEGMADYLTYLKKIVDAGLYNTALLGTYPWEGLGPQLRADNKVSLEHSYFSQTWLEADIVNDEDAAFAPVLLDDGDGRVVMMREGITPGYNSKTFVNAKAKDMEAVVDLMDYVLTSKEFDILKNGGIEGQTFYWVKGSTNNFEPLEGVEGVDFIYDPLTNPLVRMETYYDLNDTLQDPNLTDINLGRFLYIMPAIGYGYYPIDDKLTPTEYDYKNVANNWIYEQVNDEDGDNLVNNHTTQLMAMITSEEAEIIERYETVLTTYSEELLMNMVLGNTAIEDLDQYVEEMRAMGLDEYLNVFDQRRQRFLDAAAGNAAEK